jgi:hypothetical protein
MDGKFRGWLDGGSPPPGYGVYCTGCRECATVGHVPFPWMRKEKAEPDAPPSPASPDTPVR